MTGEKEGDGRQWEVGGMSICSVIVGALDFTVKRTGCWGLLWHLEDGEMNTGWKYIKVSFWLVEPLHPMLITGTM